MKAFRCGDVVPGCREEFLGADREDVLERVAAHARTAHGLTPDEQLVRLVDPLLREVEEDPGRGA